MIWHWLNIEFWGPMWPNIFAPSFFTVLAIVISHVKIKAHQEKQHAELKKKLRIED